jgi:hypothetical protein
MREFRCRNCGIRFTTAIAPDGTVELVLSASLHQNFDP